MECEIVSDSIVLIPMTEAEARACANDIKNHAGKLRTLVHDFYTREGWKALGYESFAACAEAEFDRSYQHLYRLVSATELEQELSAFSPIGEKIALPETHARKIKSLPTPETRYEAWQTAQQMASSEGSDVVAQRHVDKAVEVTAKKLRVFASQYAPLSQMVATGHLSVEDAEDIAVRIDRLKPQARGYVLQQLVKAGGIRGDVLTFVGEQYQRGDDPLAALVVQTLNVTGCLGGTPLKHANMTDARRALYEARLEVESDQHYEEDDEGATVLTLYQRNVFRSREMLIKMMGKAWFNDLFELECLERGRQSV